MHPGPYLNALQLMYKSAIARVLKRHQSYCIKKRFDWHSLSTFKIPRFPISISLGILLRAGKAVNNRITE
jgi:hypothetical protein